MTDLTGLTIRAEQILMGDLPNECPCLFVDSDDSAFIGMGQVPPPCPIIAIGHRSGVAAKSADAVVPDGNSAKKILASISGHPATAQVIVALLRLLEHVPGEQGLVAESMAYGLLQGSSEHHDWLANREQATTGAPAGKIQMTRDGGCLNIILDRPEHDNTIDRAMRDGLAEAFQLAALDDSITQVRLSGAGRSFSLGADLSEFGTTRDPATAHRIRQHTLPAKWALRCAGKLETHVQGACVGAGLEIAAFSRRLTARSRAWFQLPELQMGLLPGAGGCVSLSRRIGRQRTGELILTGERLSARQALEWGLIDGIVD